MSDMNVAENILGNDWQTNQNKKKKTPNVLAYGVFLRLVCIYYATLASKRTLAPSISPLAAFAEQSGVTLTAKTCSAMYVSFSDKALANSLSSVW